MKHLTNPPALFNVGTGKGISVKGSSCYVSMIFISCCGIDEESKFLIVPNCFCEFQNLFQPARKLLENQYLYMNRVKRGLVTTLRCMQTLAKFGMI